MTTLPMKQSDYLRLALTALLARGWSLGDVDGVRCVTVDDALEEVNAVSSAQITVVKNGRKSWVHAVWQGPDESYDEPQEIIADHSVRLSEVLDRLPLWISAFNRVWLPLADEAKVDSAWGAEHTRVFGEWVRMGCPAGASEWVVAQANRPIPQ